MENGFTILTPFDYVIVNSIWLRVEDIDEEDNSSCTLIEFVVLEE